MADKQTIPDNSNSALTLLASIERLESLDDEIAEVKERQKDEMAAVKSMGFDTKIVRKILARRKRKPDEINEEESLIDTYERAIEEAKSMRTL
jgi:uncharacterized protein (UPF0335 family)